MAFGYGDMKGWQAVPIIIPSFLIITIGTIWYFSFHHFKDRPPHQHLPSPANSASRSSRPSQTSEVTSAGLQSPGHLVHLIDIPPLPPEASNGGRRGGAQIPAAALRAQRSRESPQCGETCSNADKNHCWGIRGGNLCSDRCNMSTSERPTSYVVDLGTPPPIPTAHLHTPTHPRASSAPPIPLTPMSTMPSGSKQTQAHHLSLDSRSVYSDHSPHFSASPRSVNDPGVPTMGEVSAASTETPSPIDFGLPYLLSDDSQRSQLNVSREPEEIFVARNLNFIFPTVERVQNPAIPVDTTADNDSGNNDGQEQDAVSRNPHRSYVQSLATSMRSLLHIHPNSYPKNGTSTDVEAPYRPCPPPPKRPPRPSTSISLSISTSDVPYHHILDHTTQSSSEDHMHTDSASSSPAVIQNRSHDQSQHFHQTTPEAGSGSALPVAAVAAAALPPPLQRPAGWVVRKSADSVEAEVISRQMKCVDERLGREIDRRRGRGGKKSRE